MYLLKDKVFYLYLELLPSTEGKVKKVSIFEMIIGIIGILLIIVGYYISSKLFGGDFTTMNELFLSHDLHSSICHYRDLSFL